MGSLANCIYHGVVCQWRWEAPTHRFFDIASIFPVPAAVDDQPMEYHCYLLSNLLGSWWVSCFASIANDLTVGQSFGSTIPVHNSDG